MLNTLKLRYSQKFINFFFNYQKVLNLTIMICIVLTNIVSSSVNSLAATVVTTTSATTTPFGV